MRESVVLRARHFTRESKRQAHTPGNTGNAFAASRRQAGAQPHPETASSLLLTISLLGRQQHPCHHHPFLDMLDTSFHC